MNTELLRKAVNQILDHPETWDQTTWHSNCGTKHCIAGHCQILAGYQQDALKAQKEAQQALKLDDQTTRWLFCSARTLSDIYKFAKEAIANPNGYNRGGYDHDGYDRDGYNRGGYDRDGKILPNL